MHNQILHLVKTALWSGGVDESLFADCHWDELLTIAKEQAVLGLVLSSVKKLPIDYQPERKAMLRKLGVVAKIQERNALMDKATVAICRIYKKNNIQPLIMKGQVIACEYPMPNLRHSGDIDICFRTQQEAQQAYRFVENKTAFVKHPVVNEKEQPFSWKGVTFENHERIADMMYSPYQQAMQRILSNELENGTPRSVLIQDEVVETLPLSLTLFHLIVHLQHHILNEGIGLRQFCDLALFTRNHSAELLADSQRINEWLADCGLVRIAAVIGKIISQYLGVEPEMIPWNISPSDITEKEIDKSVRMVMDDIWTGGNFGKKIWGFKAKDGFLTQKIKALPLHWAQYRKYRHLLPNEAWTNFKHKFIRAARGVK